LVGEVSNSLVAIVESSRSAMALLHVDKLHFFLSLSAMVLLSTTLNAQSLPTVSDPLSVHASSRIGENIEEGALQLLPGNRHWLARPEFDAGAVAGDLPMEKMVLVLDSSAEQQAALDALLEQQRDPASPNYRQWLTPEQFGEHFGASAEDVQRIVDWLRNYGMRIDEVAASHRSITFSGTASQVERVFATSMRQYRANGELHIANASDPSIPTTLAPVVNGVLSLHDFRLKAMHSQPLPQVTYGNAHYLAPADLAAIYDVSPLYSQGVDGRGQSVAVVARWNIKLSDVQSFRSMFGLPANTPQVIVNGIDPGATESGELVEATLDAEYAGALAPSATVKFVTSVSTATSDGTYLSAQYIVNQNLAPVMTMSFGLCEADLGASGNAFINALWQQAAAQGITVLVSAGDSGAAGCDSASTTVARYAPGVNGLCSTPYDLCIGGTEFNDVANPSLYWSATNASNTMASALGYIPEVVWNESGDGLRAGGGGRSRVYSKPTWQSGMGVPADGHRDVPDLSLAAAGHDGYLIVLNGQQCAVGGTSAATPTLAGLFALVGQSTGTRLGLANPNLYTLASQQSSGGAAVFHDITSGSNSVPGVKGFSAGAGFDLASGLGSVDASALVTNWSKAQGAPSLKVTLGASSLTASATTPASVSLQTVGSGSFNAAVKLAVSGLPMGIKAAFTPASIAAQGSGSSTLQLTVASTVAAGSYKLNVTASGGGLTSTAAGSVTVVVPTLAVSASASSVSILPGAAGTVTFTSAVNSALSSSVALKITGLPTGVTASFTPSTIAAPGSGSSVLTLSAASSTKGGSYALTVMATAGRLIKSVTISLKVPSSKAAANASSISVARGATGAVTVTTAIAGGFSASMSLSVSGLPAGVSATLSPSTLPAPGAGSSVIRLTASTSATLGVVHLAIGVSGGGLAASVPVSLTIGPQPTFTLTAVSPSTTSPDTPVVAITAGGRHVALHHDSTERFQIATDAFGHGCSCGSKPEALGDFDPDSGQP
jgi:pseudomonalisin